MDGRLDQSAQALTMALGRQSAFWGLGKTAGELYTVLYLSAEPLALQEVARRINVTKGNVSVAVRQLERLGMVRRHWRTGDRRVFFEAETDFWKIAHAILAQRQKPEFDRSFALVEESAELARQADPSVEKEFALGRLAALQELYRLLDRAAGIALSLGPDQLKSMVEMLGQFRVETTTGE